MTLRRRANPLPRATRAFTLAELGVAMAMFSVVAVALGSAVMLASRAVPDARNPAATQLATSRVAEEMCAELSFALTFEELTATAVTFTVADRNGDAQPERIRYRWSGAAGAPVTRQYNGGPAVVVLEDAREFALVYDRRAVLQPTTYTESGESLLFSYTGSVLNLPAAFTVTKTNWCAQAFDAGLPGGIYSWSVTRVQFQARQSGSAAGEVRVQLRPASETGVPTTKVVRLSKLSEASLPSSFGWIEVPFSGANGLSPTQNYCIVFRWSRDTEACDVMYHGLSLALGTGPKYSQTTNSGSSFSLDGLRVMPMRVYGRVTTQDPPTYRYYLTGVRPTMRVGTDTSARVTSAARVLVEPEVAAP